MQQKFYALFGVMGFIWGAQSVFAHPPIVIPKEKKVEKVPVDVTAYSLFKPMPRKDWGPMEVDRPNKTAAPYTVAPGAYQFEFGLFSYIKDHNKTRNENVKTREYSLFEVNYRVGLLHNLELSAIIIAHTDAKTRDFVEKTTTKQNGFNDTLLQLKYNFWGNDGKGPTAFGVIPSVKIPTNEDGLGNHYVEGSITFPFDIRLSDPVSLSAMAVIGRVRGEHHKEYVWSFPVSVCLSYDFMEQVNGYVEVYGEKSTEGQSKWISTLGTGGTFNLSDNWVIDAGVNIGLTKAAADFNFLCGISVRL
jgi:hypothetical protein